MYSGDRHCPWAYCLTNLAILVQRTNNRFYYIYGYLITAVNNEIDESIEKRNDLLVYIKLFTI